MIVEIILARGEKLITHTHTHTRASIHAVGMLHETHKETLEGEKQK